MCAFKYSSSSVPHWSLGGFFLVVDEAADFYVPVALNHFEGALRPSCGAVYVLNLKLCAKL